MSASQSRGQLELEEQELPTILTVEETARFLRIGRSACYEAIRLNRIPHFRIGKHIRVGRPQLLAWMETGGLEQSVQSEQTESRTRGLQAVGAATQPGEARHAESTGHRLRSV